MRAVGGSIDPKRTFVATEWMSQTEVERSLRPRRRISRLLGTRRWTVTRLPNHF